MTVLPAIPYTDTVPSDRLATRASVPWRLIESPAGEAPASRVAMTAGGEVRRSMTDTRLSGTCLVGSAGSIFIAEVTRARLSSGVMATLTGGPTTLAGAGISATTRGGEDLRSMMVTVSGAGLWTTWTVPLTSTTLLSLADMASWAKVAGATPRVRRAVSSRLGNERMGPPWRQGWREVWGNFPARPCQARMVLRFTEIIPPSARWSSPARRRARAWGGCGSSG